MKSVIEILKKVRKNFQESQKYLGMPPKGYVEKLIRNFRKIKKIFPGNF